MSKMPPNKPQQATRRAEPNRHQEQPSARLAPERQRRWPGEAVDMRCSAALLAVLFTCCGGGSDKPHEVRMPNDPPVSHAELRALFDFLDAESGSGYQCDHKYTLTRRFLAKRKLPVEDMVRWLG